MTGFDFEWHEDKNARNIAKHGIDFEDAIAIFDAPLFIRYGNPGGEERFVAVGMMADLEIAVVYTRRGSTIRLISARRARRNERQAYHQAFGRRP